EQDMEKALAVKAFQESEKSAMFILPNERWARRISGVLGNELANRFPSRAHAILTERNEKIDGEVAYVASIRVPKNKSMDAAELASNFGGGGRKGAAGIDSIVESRINDLFEVLETG
ncbi:MAG: DHHA1 domain-containing protein, partial [Colwellia sp.]